MTLRVSLMGPPVTSEISLLSESVNSSFLPCSFACEFRSPRSHLVNPGIGDRLENVPRWGNSTCKAWLGRGKEGGKKHTHKESSAGVSPYRNTSPFIYHFCIISLCMLLYSLQNDIWYTLIFFFQGLFRKHLMCARPWRPSWIPKASLYGGVSVCAIDYGSKVGRLAWNQSWAAANGTWYAVFWLQILSCWHTMPLPWTFFAARESSSVLGT